MTTERSDEELLAEIENADGGHGPDPVVTASGELARVAVASLEVKSAESRLDDAVAAARNAGHTWQAIGEILGMTRQGALKRFRDTAA